MVRRRIVPPSWEVNCMGLFCCQCRWRLWSLLFGNVSVICACRYFAVTCGVCICVWSLPLMISASYTFCRSEKIHHDQESFTWPIHWCCRTNNHNRDIGVDDYCTILSETARAHVRIRACHAHPHIQPINRISEWRNINNESTQRDRLARWCVFGCRSEQLRKISTLWYDM